MDDKKISASTTRPLAPAKCPSKPATETSENTNKIK